MGSLPAVRTAVAAARIVVDFGTVVVLKRKAGWGNCPQFASRSGWFVVPKWLKWVANRFESLIGDSGSSVPPPQRSYSGGQTANWADCYSRRSTVAIDKLANSRLSWSPSCEWLVLAEDG